MSIRNPIEWGIDQYRTATHAVSSAGHDLGLTETDLHAPVVRTITVADLKDVLGKGFDDFGANRTDVVFLCVLYPVLGLLLAGLASGREMMPLVFPLASGFALVGPLAGVGLYEMSRRREQGKEVSWVDTFGVLRSHSLGAIVVLGLLLAGILVLWLVAAEVIYLLTLGPEPPASVAAFINDVFTTPGGWALIGVGVSVGFLFAVVAFAISVVSFPLLLDRDVGLETAVRTSIRAVAVNPVPMAVWGLIVAGSLVIGSIPLFLGLVVILPVLGHSTWHLYRKIVPR